MKTTAFHPTCIRPAAITALLIALSSAAGAWPFAFKSTGVWNITAQSRFIAFQADSDRRLELFSGGNILLQPAGNTGAITTLPTFDNDPYHSSNTSVNFALGHGDTGDLDGDGDLDLVRSAVLTYNGNVEGKFRMMTCLNDGSGNFTRGWHWQIENFDGPKYQGFPVKLADLDRDGDLELIETYEGLKVRWNPGNGNFSSGASPVGPADVRYHSVVIEDFDHDGTLDIVTSVLTAGNTQAIRLHANDGNGLFTSSVIQSGNSPYNLAAADINGDGRKDLVGYDYIARKLEYRRNTGSGFAAPSLIGNVNSNTSKIPTFDVGDLDEDGRLDIAVSHYEGEVLWLRGDGAGGFGAPVTLRAAASSNVPNMIAIADMDRDGDNDVIYDAGYNFLENTAPHREAAFTASTWAGTSPSGAVTLEVADLNGDGRKDLIAADGGGKRILWYPAGSSGLVAPVTVNTGGTSPSSVAAADFNRDGFTDLAYVSNSTITRMYSSNGGGIGWYSGTAGIIVGATRIVTGDLEGDGDVDLLSFSPSSGTMTWHKNNGDGSAYSLEMVDNGLNGITSFAVGQETAGGRLEVCSLISGSYGYDNRHRHDGTAWKYTVGSNVPTAGDSSAVVIGDVQDSSAGLEAVTALNTGSIRVQTAAGYLKNVVSNQGTVRKLGLVDWNLDGYTDIIAAGSEGVRLYLHARTSTWTLGGTVNLLPEACTDVAVLDVDGDRIPDAVGVEATGTLRLIENHSRQLTLINTAAGSSAVPFRVFPGTAGDAINCSYTSRGYSSVPSGFSADAVVAPSKITVRFLKAVSAPGGGYMPGAAMTAGEISAAISSVSLSGSTSTSTSNASGGNLSLYPTGLAQAVYSVSAGQTKNFAIRLQVTANAALAPVTRFFVQHLTENAAAPSTWAILDGGTPGPVQARAGATVSGVTSLIEVKAPTPLETWRDTHFGTYANSGNAANDFDYDRDGVPNIVEYALGTHPKVAEGNKNQSYGLLVVPFTSSSQEVQVRLSLSDAAITDPKLKVRVQTSSGMIDWNTLATRTGVSAWSGAIPAQSISGGRTFLTFNSGLWNSVMKRSFFRLVVEEIP